MAKRGVSALAANDTSPRDSRSRRFIVVLTIRECDLLPAYGMGVGKGESVYSTGWRKPRQKRAGRFSRAHKSRPILRVLRSSPRIYVRTSRRQRNR
jgi:hypothetical protein